MAGNPVAPRSRRTIIAAAVGGAAAWAAAALGRAAPVQADDGTALVVGRVNTAQSTTRIESAVSRAPTLDAYSEMSGALHAESGGATAIVGLTTGDDAAIVGCSAASHVAGLPGPLPKVAVLGYSAHPAGGVGVIGAAAAGTGLFGFASGSPISNLPEPVPIPYPVGVVGAASGGTGLFGFASGSPISTLPEPVPIPYPVGVVGAASGGTGVFGFASGSPISTLPEPNPIPYPVGVVGAASGGTGVFGFASGSPISTLPDPLPKVAINGICADPAGHALRTSGRVAFDKVSGVAKVRRGARTATVRLAVDVTSSSYVLLTPRADIGTRRLWYTLDARANTITIRVSSAPTSDLLVNWLCLG